MFGTPVPFLGGGGWDGLQLDVFGISSHARYVRADGHVVDAHEFGDVFDMIDEVDDGAPLREEVRDGADSDKAARSPFKIRILGASGCGDRVAVLRLC